MSDSSRLLDEQTRYSMRICRRQRAISKQEGPICSSNLSFTYVSIWPPVLEPAAGEGAMQIEFPIEFIVQGTPVSQQAKRAESREEWKGRVKSASSSAIPQPHFASDERIAVTLYYFSDEPMAGDIDNIVKPILDALSRHIYIDDRQVERIVAQKFEPPNVFTFSRPTPKFAEAIGGQRPNLYVRVSNDPFEELS